MKKILLGLLSTACLFGLNACTTPQSTNVEPEYSLIVETLPPTTTALQTTPTETTETAVFSTTVSSDITVYETTIPKEETSQITTAATTLPEAVIDRNGSYTSKDDVALYIHTYGELPSNFITKKEAQALGWTGGSLEPYAKGECIGGTYFGNYEGVLPKKKGRQYTECDIDTLGKSSRGAKRIVFSNDGLIYYTDDHYETFTLLYGEETT